MKKLIILFSLGIFFLIPGLQNNLSAQTCAVGSQQEDFTASGSGATGSAQTWTVPAGVSEVTLNLIGADGGNRGNGVRIGGAGAEATGTFAVSAGDVLNVIVGQAGANGTASDDGAGGGGGTAIYNATSGTLLLVAAGGSGAGFNGNGFGGLADIGAAGTGGAGNHAGGGGGATAAGGNGSQGNGGGAGGTDGSNGGTGNSGADGGYGFGGGGEAGDGGQGGGSGGYDGGKGGSNAGGGQRGSAGNSFNDVSGTSVSITAGADGGSTNSDGSATICYVGLPPIPTMGEWALIIFGLIVLSFGIVYVMKWKNEQKSVMSIQ